MLTRSTIITKLYYFNNNLAISNKTSFLPAASCSGTVRDMITYRLQSTKLVSELNLRRNIR
ncbi:hypothetical protein Hanom_Chr08g00691091 [Helianthus anomalus]